MVQRRNMLFPIIITVLVILVIIYLIGSVKQPYVSCSRSTTDDLGIKLVENLVTTLDGNKIKKMELTKTIILPKKYLDSDKAVANKNIHSNNYMSFFIKKETLDLEKFLKKQKEKNKKIQDINDIKIFILDFIDDYFNTLENPKKNKSKIRNNKKTLNLYKEIEKEIGEPNIEKVNYCRNWIKENIFQIGENLKDYKGYLKIFFDFPIEEYEKESNRYIIPNIYNSNDYNTEFNGERLKIARLIRNRMFLLLLV